MTLVNPRIDGSRVEGFEWSALPERRQRRVGRLCERRAWPLPPGERRPARTCARTRLARRAEDTRTARMRAVRA